MRRLIGILRGTKVGCVVSQGRVIVCTKTRYRIEGRFGRLRRGPRMRDIPERCRRHTRAIIFSERGASGRPGRGFAHLLRLRRLSRPRQKQQQDDQQRPPHARSSPTTPHILPTVPSRPSRELTASLLSDRRLATDTVQRFGPCLFYAPENAVLRLINHNYGHVYK